MKEKFNVINLHLIERCNYSCKYCYAVFNTQRREYQLEDWKQVVDRIKIFFESNQIKGRINLAGGEPMLVSFLDALIDYIYAQGIDVSIITNGSTLDRDRINRWENKVSMIGVSVDSLDNQTNLTIGRHQSGFLLDYDKLVKTLNYAQSKGIKLKVNTVISRDNLDQDISKLYHDINFDRIKIFQVSIQDNCNKKAIDSKITNDEFEDYITKLKSKVSNQIIVETNDLMESSYIIIDPIGHLISNANQTYERIGNVLEESLENLLIKANLDIDKFNYRYQKELKQ